MQAILRYGLKTVRLSFLKKFFIPYAARLARGLKAAQGCAFCCALIFLKHFLSDFSNAARE